MAWSVAATNENEAMNFYNYFPAPQKILTSVKFVGTTNIS
jgi:hypothetical protein